MNRIFNYCTALLLSALTLSLGSCTEEYEYTGTTADGQQVYFSNNLESQIDLSPTQTSVTVPVNRIQRGGALTVDLNVTVEKGSQLSVSNQVTFNDGDSVAYITINYDPNVIEYGDYDSITVSIPDASLTTPYGNTSYTFTAGLSEWETLGTGYLRDGIMSYVAQQMGFAVDMQTYQVQIEESVLTPGKYRISNPFGEGTAFYESVRDIEGFAWEGGNTGIIIDATDPSFVYIANDFYSGYNIKFQDQPVNPHFYSFVDLNMRFYDIPLDALKQQAPQQFGQLSNGVITFPAAALGFLLSGDYIDDTNTPLYQGNTGDLAVALPGYEITDYSSAFTYRGCFTDVAGNSYAQGTITLGDDVASARYIVAGEGDDLAAIIEGIADGSVEATEITESGEVSIPLDESGNYTMVIVTFNASGEMQSSSTTAFTFTTSTTKVNWQVECEGTYDQNFLPNFITDKDDSGNTFYVGNPLGDGTYTTTLYVDADNPNHFKLEPWLLQTGHLEFTINESGIISFGTFDTGAETGSPYGNMYVLNAEEYFNGAAQGQPCSFYAQEGYFVFGCMYFVYMNGEYGWMGGTQEVFAPEGVDMPEKQSAPINLSRNQLKSNKIVAITPNASNKIHKNVKSLKAEIGKSQLKARPFRMK